MPCLLSYSDQLPRSSYPTTVTELILVCYAVVAFAVPETIVVYAIASELTPIASREDDAVRIADSPKASFKRKLTWKGVSRMWKNVRKSKYSTKVAFTIDMLSLALSVLTIIICSLVIFL